MMSSWMDNLRSWLQPGSGRAGRTPRGRARLRVEHLEVRDTPSITIGGPAPVLGPPPVWQPVGPVSIADSTSNTLPTGANFSAGATESISVDPFNPNRVAIGTVNGGVWVTNNYTTVNPVWTTHTDALPSLAIGSVAWSPTLPNTLFAGSGSYSAGGLDGTFHAGIGVAFPGTGGAPGFFYRSNDGGNTWSQLGGTTFSGQRIANVVPTTLNGGQTIFVGTSDRPVTSSGGVYRSNDGGNTWTRLSGANGLPNLAVTSVIADPTNPNRFYAAAVGGAGAGIYLLDATNGNVAWVNVSGNLSTAVLAGADRILLSATPAGVKPIYAAILSPDPALPGSGANLLTGIFRAVAYPGPTYVWTAIGPNGLPPDVTPGGQGSIHFAIAADPASDRTVYVAGDRRREPPFDAVIARGDAIQNTWTAITDYPAPATPPTPGTVDPLVSSPAPTTAPHADTRYMAFAGNAILVA